MSLKIGKKITRYSWDEIPMPDTVIYRVKKLGESQPEYFIFTDSRGRQNVGVELIGLDGEITKALLQIQNVENHDLNQSDLVDEELAAQPDQENEEDLQQQDQVRDQPEVELLQEHQEQPPETSLVEP